MFLESLSLSGLYDLIVFSGKLFLGKFHPDFRRAKDYAALQVVEKFPDTFPSKNFADYVFKIDDPEVRKEIVKLKKGLKAMDTSILTNAIEKDLIRHFPQAKFKVNEIVKFFIECMIEKLKENLEIRSYFMERKLDDIAEKLNGIMQNYEVLMPATRQQIEREIAKVGKKYISTLYVNRKIERTFEKFVNSNVRKNKEDSKRTKKNCFLIIDKAGL